MVPDVNKLCRHLGYEFANHSLLNAALTHRSVRGNNNERLEFLGDSIVNFIIAQALYEQFPDRTEGELSRLRANLVRGETLAELAKEFSIGDYLHMGPGELKSGGHRRISILADALEAIIAAIYLDSDMEVCRARVLEWFKDRLLDRSLTTNMKDPKTRLQEYLQSRKLNLPNYKISNIEGDAHNQMFHIECTVDTLDYVSQGTGTSRRRAEQEAAENFLAQLEQCND